MVSFNSFLFCFYCSFKRQDAIFFSFASLKTESRFKILEKSLGIRTDFDEIFHVDRKIIALFPSICEKFPVYSENTIFSDFLMVLSVGEKPAPSTRFTSNTGITTTIK